jgi:uncharacterized protein
MPSKPRIIQNVLRDQSVAGGREVSLTFRLGDGDAVPALLLLPDAATPTPAALLLHGYSSDKELLSGTIGRALLAEGVASLSVDLPLHGSRADALEAQAVRNPLALAGLWRKALAEVRLAVGYLRAHRACDARRLAVVGYSMGAFLSLELAAREASLRAVVLAAGGDLPQAGTYDFALRMLVDPMRAVRKLDGRPLLMIHGLRDRTITPEQARRLFDAAAEPKEIRWLDAGHRLPPQASGDVAGWLCNVLLRAS